MPFDEKLAARIRKQLGKKKGLVEKRVGTWRAASEFPGCRNRPFVAWRNHLILALFPQPRGKASKGPHHQAMNNVVRSQMATRMPKAKREPTLQLGVGPRMTHKIKPIQRAT